MAALLAGAGALAGTVGSFLGAQSANRAARSQRIAQGLEVSGARRRQGVSMFGPQDYADYEQATGNQRDWHGKKWVQVGESWVPLDASAASRFFGKYGSTQDNLRNLSSMFGNELDANLGRMEQGTRRLDTLAAGAEGAVSDFGNQGEQGIVREMDRARLGANQQSIASLSNLGSNTLAANQVGQNNRRFAEGTQDALTNLRSQRLQQFLGARGQRLSTMFGRTGATDVARDANTRTKYTMAREPVDQQQALASGQAFQPYTPLLGANQSPLGSALGSASTALNTYGAMGMFSGGGGRPAADPNDPRLRIPPSPRFNTSGSLGLFGG